MNSIRSTLALRYAKAFLNVFKSTLGQQENASLEKCAQFLDSHLSWLFLCNLSLIPLASKERMIDEVCKQYGLVAAYTTLFLLLVQHQRVFLFSTILRIIKKEYMRDAKIYEFKVESSCILSVEQKISLEAALQQQLGDVTVDCDYCVNPALIAGIAVKSETLVWEDSIRKYLITIGNSVRC